MVQLYTVIKFKIQTMKDRSRGTYDKLGKVERDVPRNVHVITLNRAVSRPDHDSFKH